MLIYYAQIGLEEGFEVMRKQKHERLVNGRQVSCPSGKILFEKLHNEYQPLRCWKCGIEANCFIVSKGRNDFIGPPVMELYVDTGTEVILMTRDHIIPKSLGGSNDVANLRVGCGPCNHGRGNKVNEEDREFREANPHLIVPGFVPKEQRAPLTEEEKARRKEDRRRARKIARQRKAKKKAELRIEPKKVTI